MIQSWCNLRHLNCIKSSKGESRESDPTQISAVAEVPRPAPMTSTTLEIGEKKGFMRLDESVRNLILNDSAPTSEVAAGAPCENCKKIL